MSDTRAILYGLGVTGRRSAEMMLEKGVQIVGAIDTNPDIVGKDLGEVIDLNRSLGVIVSDDAETVLAETAADVVLIGITSGLDKMSPHYERCIRNGKNVLSTAEDFVYPWRIAPDLAKDLDELAKKHGVSLASSGIQDVYLVNMVLALSGACHQIDEIEFVIEANLGHTNRDNLLRRGLCLEADEFRELWEKTQPHAIDSMSSSPEAIAASLGLTPTSIDHAVEPILAEKDIEIPDLGVTIRKGTVAGYRVCATVVTEEMNLSSVIAFLYFGPERSEFSPIDIRIKGDPDVQVSASEVDVHRATCTQMVNRIPDIIKADPGIITAEKLPRPQFRTSPMSK